MNLSPKARSRVLFVLPALCLGGSQRVLVNVLNHIDTLHFEPHLAVLKEAEIWLDPPSNVQIHELGTRRARHAIWSLAKLCWKLRPQAVLSTSAHMNSALIGARFLLPPRTLLLVREGADITSPQVRLSRVRTLLYKHAYRRADRVICQSDYMKETLIREFELRRDAVVRIYNPVDIRSLESLAASETNPFLNTGVNLVAAGRFSQEKGFDLLLRAMARVRQVRPHAVLTLLGEGPDLHILQAIRQDLDLRSSVGFVGVQRNPYPFLKHADLVVLPSRTEAFPNVVLEAIALGTPVVATNCTVALGEIASCTPRVRIARNITHEALASEILEAIDDRAMKGKRGFEPRFEACFGVQGITREYEQVLNMGMVREPSAIPEPLNVGI